MNDRTGDAATFDVFWNAVRHRDRHFDGRFVYVAVTTGIYSRPSCPARHPLRRNTLFFPTPADAEREGFVACRRCTPDSHALTAAEQCIEAAIKYIEAHSNQRVTLGTLSQVTGLSPNHLQQTFTRLVGLSPRAFCDARRLATFKRLLRLGESIRTAGYGAGYDSSRALYETAKKNLGMTPASYQRGGEGVCVRYAIAKGSWCSVLVGSTDSGVCTVLVGESDDLLVTELQEELPKASLVRDAGLSDAVTAAVQASRVEDPLLLTLPIGLRRTILQARVLAWRTGPRRERRVRHGTCSGVP